MAPIFSWSRGTGAGAEITDRQALRSLLPSDPGRGQRKPLGQQFDVEDVPAIGRFLIRQQVEQQCDQAGASERSGHVVVAWAQATAAAAVCE